MKTLTVTFHYAPNYGAVLQTYALQQTILSLGHGNEVLDIKLSKNSRQKTSLSIKIRKLIIRLACLLKKKQVDRLKNHFSEFHKKYIYLTRTYSSMDELRNDNIDADCLITGSDQVWNFRTRLEFLDSRMLNFGKKDALRFSYAASMESTNLQPAEKERLSAALQNFSGISLREENVRNYVQTLTNKQCVRVLDPVFLLTQEKWNKIAIEPRYKGEYILCYQVLSNKSLPLFAKKLRAKTGLPVISICNGAIRWFNADYSFFDVSIEEFLGFYKNATYILSASFHGVAMGLVYEKPVYAFVKKNGGNRIKEVIHLFNLDRFLIEEVVDDCLPLYSENDFLNIRQKKERYSNKSFDFLESMLQND